jgi:hypothetical protein
MEQKRRLPRSVGTHNRNAFPFLDGERNPFESGRAVRIAVSKMADFKGGHGRYPRATMAR